jgi:signal transduction histidine kinase
LPAVPLDARLVRQAVLNLALNAIQAMPAGGTLRLRLGREASGGRPMAVLEVADTGPGIDREVRARMFEPFFTTKATGTGLGLAVVRRIVQSHQGDLVVTSEEGKGTVVRLRLPLEPEPRPAVSPPA